MESNIIIPIIVINVAAVAVMVAVAVSGRAALPPAPVAGAAVVSKHVVAGELAKQPTKHPIKPLPEGVTELVLGAAGTLLALSAALPLDAFLKSGGESAVTKAVIDAIGKSDVKGLPMIVSRGKLVDLGLQAAQGSGDGPQAEAQALEVFVGTVVKQTNTGPFKYFIAVSNAGGPRLVRAALARWLAASNTMRDYSEVTDALKLLNSVLKVAVPIRLMNLYVGAVPSNKFTLALIQQSASDDAVQAAAALFTKAVPDASVYVARRRPLTVEEKLKYGDPIFACDVEDVGKKKGLLLQYPTFARIVDDANAYDSKRPDPKEAMGTIVEAGASQLIDPPASAWMDGSVKKVANHVSDADAKLINGLLP